VWIALIDCASGAVFVHFDFHRQEIELEQTDGPKKIKRRAEGTTYTWALQIQPEGKWPSRNKMYPFYTCNSIACRGWRWREVNSHHHHIAMLQQCVRLTYRAVCLLTLLLMCSQVGIVGLPNVGKSTLFNTLTKMGIPAENFPFCTIDPNHVRPQSPSLL
jgi:hypothetical protein